MERKIRVAAVSYLNTKPLLYGIERSAIMNNMELLIDYPARIAEMLLNDEIDMGLVPVAIIPKLKAFYINTDICIGSIGPVASVCLFSEVPLQHVKKVLLDYQSKTSVQLAKVLLKEYWNMQPELENATEDFRSRIQGNVAGLVIGDRALEQRLASPYIYDLGEAWKNHTGLPFVYAAWVSNKKIDEGFVNEFTKANHLGVQSIPELLAGLRYEDYDLESYYTENIDYLLDDEKRKGLDLFLQKI